jgi:hypothetical protein
MTVWKVTFTLDDSIPNQATILTTIRNNVGQLTDGTNNQAHLELQKVG